MLSHILRFVKEEDGASAVEYGLLVALIAVVIWVAVSNIGTALNNMFTQIASNLSGAGGGGGGGS